MSFSDEIVTMEDGRRIVRRVVLRPASPPSSPESSVSSRSSTRSTPSPPRRQPLILKEPAKPGARCAEVAGGTAAECAAVWCCCPCGLVNLVVLVAVKLPAGLCRRAVRTRRRKKKRSSKGGGGAGEKSSKKVGLLASDKDDQVERGSKRITAVEGWPAKAAPSVEEEDMEKEMWEKFYSAGFWRSPSQRD